MISTSSNLSPTPTDAFPTLTSLAQTETETVLQEYIPISSNAPPPKLEKRAHMQFLIRNLIQGFPGRYMSQDASQPWLLFWTLQSFSTLQVGLDPGNKQRAIEKILSWQHPDGGFGGGPGQAAHLLPTYASVCSLAIVGGPGPKGGWDQIDREKMYKFFMSLKQKDGSFLVSKHSEVDVRGIYCLLVAATLLDILTPELVEGTAEFISSCQTYEGGFASSSQPYFSAEEVPTLLKRPRPSLGEAHGGYTYCSVASWMMLQPFNNEGTCSPKPKEQKPSINIPNLLRWLVQMQGSEIELGGFKGRTNKLVDGCYSWWCGGVFPLLEALGVQAYHPDMSLNHPPEAEDGSEGLWDDVDGNLYDREALQQYLLYVAQHPTGGLRDKPPKNADAYHTLYCLSGLSSAQHHVVPSSARETEILARWISGTKHEVDEDLRKEIFVNIMSWSEDESNVCILGGSANRVNATHPITNLTITHTEGMMAYFYGQILPPRQRPPPPK